MVSEVKRRSLTLSRLSYRKQADLHKAVSRKKDKIVPKQSMKQVAMQVVIEAN